MSQVKGQHIQDAVASKLLHPECGALNCKPHGNNCQCMNRDYVKSTKFNHCTNKTKAILIIAQH